MNINILHVVSVYFSIPHFLGNQLGCFRKKGYKVHLICSPSVELHTYAKEQNIQFKEITILRKISPIRDLISVYLLYKYIKNNKIKVVTGHTPKGALLSMIASFIARVPKRIYFRHGLVYETAKGHKRNLLLKIERLTSFLATDVVCVSPSVYEKSITDKLGNKDKQKILHRGTCNGINLGKFSRLVINPDEVGFLKEQYGIKEEHIVIGFLGRLVKDKGIVELINAFDIVKKQHQNALLLLVGFFESKNSLPQEIIKKIKEDRAIICTGYIDNRFIAKYYYMMDIFVLPSFREGFPTSVLEASSMGLPVIVTRATGSVDAVVDEETGYLCSHHPKDIAQHILTLIKDVDKAIKMGEEGRKFVVENFDEKLIWREIEKLYE